MSKTTNQSARTPKLGEPVHYVGRNIGELDAGGCIAAFVNGRLRDKDGNGYPRGRIEISSAGTYTVTMSGNAPQNLGEKKEVSVSVRFVEHSAEGHAGTYHFPEECSEGL